METRYYVRLYNEYQFTIVGIDGFRALMRKCRIVDCFSEDRNGVNCLFFDLKKD